MKRQIAVLCSAVVLFGAGSGVFGADRLVPGVYPTIQAGIDAALDGDTVIVAPGTYTGTGNKRLDFGGKPITVRSADPNDPCVVAATVIDCEGSGRGFSFHSGEGPNSIVCGLTITQGNVSGNGGAIACSRSSPTIRQCVIRNNSATDGGGIFCYRGGTTIVQSTIKNNSATYGGGICYSTSGSSVLTNCLVTGNSAHYYGGGIYCLMTMEGPSITNCLITDNSAGRGGGISSLNYSVPRIRNCTITGSSANYGGAIHSTLGGSTPMVTNCILWGNTATNGPEIALTRYDSSGSGNIDVSYSDVEGGELAVYIEGAGTLYWGAGNIDADPCLLNLAGGDYHLLANSPCIDTADPNYLAGPTETDIDGEPRVMGGRVDMGVDEFTSTPTLTPVIGLSTAELWFHAFFGGPNPEPEVFHIYNESTGVISWTLAENCTWLQVDPETGSSSGQAVPVTVSVDTSGLTSGTHNCTLTISDPFALNSPQTIAVNLVVDPPVIGLSRTEFEFWADEDGPDPEVQILGISNASGGLLNWQIAANCVWVQLEPNTGSSTGETDEVTINVSASGLSPGAHDCNLVVSDPEASNSPQTVGLTLYVRATGGQLHVPSPYGTIQAAIGAAVNGDTVIVAPGIYTGERNRDLDFGGKRITVRSTDPDDPCVVAATIIDCNGSKAEPYRGFYFHSGESRDSIVAGLTITNGYVYDANGGGICCIGASPTITNCVVYNCEARGREDRSSERQTGSGLGGGISCTSASSPNIINCTINDNRAKGGDSDWWSLGGKGCGGGIYCDSTSSAKIISCLINNNEAVGGNGCDGTLGYPASPAGNGAGGGIYAASGGNVEIGVCEIYGNTSKGGIPGGGGYHGAGGAGNAYGAGICFNGQGSINTFQCTLLSNMAVAEDGSGSECDGFFCGGSGGKAYGGGFYLAGNGSGIIRNCTVSTNNAVAGKGQAGEAEGGNGGHAYGGGIYSTLGNNLDVENCAILLNSAEAGNGGQAYQEGADGGSAYGGGAYFGPDTQSNSSNCTLADNAVSGGTGGGGLIDGSDGLSLGGGAYCAGGDNLTNCILWGNDANDVDGSGYAVTYSCTEQIIAGVGNVHTDPCFVSGPEGDYYLSQVAAGQAVDSPCVNVGSDTAVRLGLDQCTTRTDGAGDEGIVDMGYHYGDCGPVTMAGDIDGDGDLDGDDYALFAAGWYCRDEKMIARGTVAVDGNLSEWSQEFGWIALDKVYSGNPNDINDAKFSVRWNPDANKVYAAVVVHDSNHIFSDEYGNWDASDRLEIYSQGDAEGGTGWYGIYDAAQQYYVAPNTAGGCWATWALGQPIDANVGLEYAVTVGGEWIVYEVGVPMFDNYGGFSGGETLLTDLSAGHVVGFDVVVCTRWGADGFGMLSENLMMGKYNDADQFARYMLIDESAGPFCDEPLCDLDGNGVCNLADLKLLTDYWLWGK